MNQRESPFDALPTTVLCIVLFCILYLSFQPKMTMMEMKLKSRDEASILLQLHLLQQPFVTWHEVKSLMS